MYTGRCQILRHRCEGATSVIGVFFTDSMARVGWIWRNNSLKLNISLSGYKKENMAHMKGNMARMKGNMALMKGNMALMKGNMALTKGNMALRHVRKT